MNDANEIWVGAVKSDGKITKNPLLFVKKNNIFYSDDILSDDILSEWAFLNSHRPYYPGLFFPSSLDCVYFCSFRREDVCSFICGVESAYCMIFHNMKKFFGNNSGEYSRNSSIFYETMMKPELKLEEENNDD